MDREKPTVVCDKPGRSGHDELVGHKRGCSSVRRERIGADRKASRVWTR